MKSKTDWCAAGMRVRGLAMGAAVLMSCVLGCSRGPELAVVEGVVALDGQPIKDVEVIFLPDSEKGNNGPRASAYTDAQGHYKVHCEQAKRDGAVLGRNRICIRDITAPGELPGMRKMPAELAPPGTPAGGPKKPRVPAVYTSAAQTPLYLDVKPGSQTYNIDLQSGRRH